MMKIRQAKKLLGILALAVLALAGVILALSTQAARAQSNNIFVDKQLGRPGNLVHVGEYLTFTIRIRNDAAFTVTTLPLSDQFNNAVLAYADANPPPDSVDPATGQIEWNDLTNAFGDLAPGQEVLVVVGFIAEHPAPVVVNQADVHDALGSGGVLSDTNSTLTDTQSVGGSSPVDKELLAGVIPEVGLPLTFTIRITNNGFTTMTVVPLVDNYPSTILQFSYAVPPPDTVDEVGGTLIWSDVTLWTGDIPAHGTVSVMTVFTALAAVDLTVNSAGVSDARDWYGNDLGAGADDVPITIIGGPATTPTPTDVPAPTNAPAPTTAPTRTPVQPAPTTTLEQPAPTAVAATPTPATATATAATPFLLPVSGQAGKSFYWFLPLVVGVGIMVLVLTWRVKQLRPF